MTLRLPALTPPPPTLAMDEKPAIEILGAEMLAIVRLAKFCNAIAWMELRFVRAIEVCILTSAANPVVVAAMTLRLVHR